MTPFATVRDILDRLFNEPDENDEDLDEGNPETEDQKWYEESTEDEEVF